MTGSAASGPRSGTRSLVRTVLATAIGGRWLVTASIAVFLFGSVTTLSAIRLTAWPAVIRWLHETGGVEVVDVTPQAVLSLQLQIAVAAGLLLTLETGCYLCRGALLGGRFWPCGPLSRQVRAVLLVLGAALFPIGFVLGYDVVFPAVFDFLGTQDPSWTIIRWSRTAFLTALVMGVVAQFAFAVGVLGLTRRGDDRVSGRRGADGT